MHNNTHHIRRAFARAALHYNQYASLQYDIAAECARRAYAHSGFWLDAGAGTGYVATHLKRLHSPVQLLAVDNAFAMCRAATPYSGVICTDMTQLPLADNIFDGVVSSLALQWVSDPEKALSEWVRVTRPGGTAIIATLGPKTLYEMAESFYAVDKKPRVNAFFSLDKLLAAVQNAGWTSIACDEVMQHRHYANLSELMHSLKTIGASHHNQGRAGLTTNRIFGDAETHYRTHFSNDQDLRATWHVIYLHLRKP